MSTARKDIIICQWRRYLFFYTAQPPLWTMMMGRKQSWRKRNILRNTTKSSESSAKRDEDMVVQKAKINGPQELFDTRYLYTDCSNRCTEMREIWQTNRKLWKHRHETTTKKNGPVRHSTVYRASVRETRRPNQDIYVNPQLIYVCCNSCTMFWSLPKLPKYRACPLFPTPEDNSHRLERIPKCCNIIQFERQRKLWLKTK